MSFEFLFAPKTCWHGINQEKEKADKREAPQPLAHAGTCTQLKGWFDLTGSSVIFSQSSEVHEITCQERIQLFTWCLNFGTSFLPNHHVVHAVIWNGGHTGRTDARQGGNQQQVSSMALWLLARVQTAPQILRSTRNIPEHCTVDSTCHQPFHWPPWCYVCGIA